MELLLTVITSVLLSDYISGTCGGSRVWGVLLPDIWTKIRHEFQLYDVTDTLRRRLDYNVGLSGLCTCTRVLYICDHTKSSFRVVPHSALHACMHLENVDHAVLQGRGSSKPLNPPPPPHGTGLYIALQCSTGDLWYAVIAYSSCRTLLWV